MVFPPPFEEAASDWSALGEWGLILVVIGGILLAAKKTFIFFLLLGQRDDRHASLKSSST